MTTSTLTLTDFLLARIAEDEAEVPCASCGRAVEPCGEDEWGHVAAAQPDGSEMAEEFWRDPCSLPEPIRRALTECEVKRQIVLDFALAHEDYQATHSTSDEVRRLASLLAVARAASVYADHPDYRDEWRP